MMRCLEDKVYIVDPDEPVHDALKALLGTAGTEVQGYENAEVFLASDAVSTAMRGCLLVEMDLPGMGSVELLRQLRTRGIDIPVIALTSVSDGDTAKQALKAGAVDVIEKPFVSAALLERLSKLCCHRESDDALSWTGENRKMRR